MQLGIERLIDGPDSGLIAGRRVGVVCNPASIDGAFRHVVDRLAASDSTDSIPTCRRT